MNEKIYDKKIKRTDLIFELINIKEMIYHGGSPRFNLLVSEKEPDRLAYTNVYRLGVAKYTHKRPLDTDINIVTDLIISEELYKDYSGDMMEAFLTVFHCPRVEVNFIVDIMFSSMIYLNRE